MRGNRLRMVSARRWRLFASTPKWISAETATRSASPPIGSSARMEMGNSTHHTQSTIDSVEELARRVNAITRFSAAVRKIRRAAALIPSVHLVTLAADPTGD